MVRLNEIAVVLLAAGRGERFGANKLRAELDGRPIAYHAPSRLAALPFGQRIAVVGAGTPDLSVFGFSEVRPTSVDAPISHSIALGVRKASDLGSRAVMIVLADMPLVPEAHFMALAENFDGDRIATLVGDTVMPPAIIAAAHYPYLLALEGDRGAGRLLINAPAVGLAPDLAIDIDRAEDLARVAQTYDLLSNEHAIERREC